MGGREELMDEHTLEWRRSPYCHSSDSVEIAMTVSHVYMRSAASPDGPWLRFSLDEWNAFVRSVKDAGQPLN
ncbi:MAG: DUF397 domain-containing protein [Betaproteobacteria bacterium]